QAGQWSMLVNVSANGNSLQKTGGCGGCGDAAAVSQQQVSAGGGYVEFSATETGTLRYIGLGPNTTNANDIRFAIRFQGTTAEVREAGTYKSEISFGSGDVFRIAVEGGSVTYSKNGSVFYTSTGTGIAMNVDVTLFDLNAAINNVMIATGSASAAATAPASQS